VYGKIDEKVLPEVRVRVRVGVRVRVRVRVSHYKGQRPERDDEND
jgi:hypothetical protein